MTDFLSTLGGLSDQVQLEFSSDLTPPAAVGLQGVSKSDGQPAPLWALVHPRIIIRLADGTELYRIAPYGEPTPPHPLVVAAVAGAAAWALYRLLRGKAP